MSPVQVLAARWTRLSSLAHGVAPTPVRGTRSIGVIPADAAEVPPSPDETSSKANQAEYSSPGEHPAQKRNTDDSMKPDMDNANPAVAQQVSFACNERWTSECTCLKRMLLLLCLYGKSTRLSIRVRLQASAADSGSVTFRDAEAASEMREYMRDSRSELQVQVHTGSKHTASQYTHMCSKAIAVPIQDDGGRKLSSLRSPRRLAVTRCWRKRQFTRKQWLPLQSTPSGMQLEGEAQDTRSFLAAPVETLMETSLEKVDTDDNDSSTGAREFDRPPM